MSKTNTRQQRQEKTTGKTFNLPSLTSPPLIGPQWSPAGQRLAGAGSTSLIHSDLAADVIREKVNRAQKVGAETRPVPVHDDQSKVFNSDKQHNET